MDVPRLIANRFRVEREIGRGGMGAVYLATHLGLDRPVAVKVLKPEYAADPEVAERFMREARTMARLRHARAAMIFDAGSLPDGRPFLVMEYVEGETLAERLAREKRFSPERAVRVACEICDVLAEAHAVGVVHRDLKPSNILLNERGVCVLDFGIAKVLADSDVTKTHATTESGLIIGTPRYMSPEQCVGQAVGPASDLYSLGVLLYEMLTGTPPFVDQLQSAVLVKQATAPPPPLVARREDVPRRLAYVTHALLAKNPNDRPRSARDARYLLEKSLVNQTQELLPPPAPFASTVAAVNRRSSLYSRAVTGVTVAVAACALLFAWGRTGREAPLGVTREVAAAPVVGAGDLAPARVEPAVAAAPVEPSLTAAAARQLAQSAVRRGVVSEAYVVRTGRGQAVVAVQERRGEGETALFMLEPRGAAGGYQVTGRAQLDVKGFGGAMWTAEAVDADGDGYEEIICTGTDSRDDAFSRRLVLYVPRTRQNYSMRWGADSRESKAVRIKWSANAAGERNRSYRAALRERALADLPSVNEGRRVRTPHARF